MDNEARLTVRASPVQHWTSSVWHAVYTRIPWAFLRHVVAGARGAPCPLFCAAKRSVGLRSAKRSAALGNGAPVLATVAEPRLQREPSVTVGNPMLRLRHVDHPVCTTVWPLRAVGYIGAGRGLSWVGTGLKHDGTVAMDWTGHPSICARHDLEIQRWWRTLERLLQSVHTCRRRKHQALPFRCLNCQRPHRLERPGERCFIRPFLASIPTPRLRISRRFQSHKNWSNWSSLLVWNHSILGNSLMRFQESLRRGTHNLDRWRIRMFHDWTTRGQWSWVHRSVSVVRRVAQWSSIGSHRRSPDDQVTRCVADVNGLVLLRLRLQGHPTWFWSDHSTSIEHNSIFSKLFRASHIMRQIQNQD